MVESEEELKSLLMKVKESEKIGLKLNIQKTNVMASSPITVNRWEINGNRLFSWVPKSLQMMTAAMKLKDTCSLEEVQFSSVAQSCPTLLPHGLQHAGLPCLSLTPGAYSNSCPSSQ